MKRFVDIRGSCTGHRFAFWDTCVDKFEEYSDEMAWDTFEEFQEAYDLDQTEPPYRANSIDRYKGLCPKWAFTPPPREEF